MSDLSNSFIYVAAYSSEEHMKDDAAAVRELHAQHAFGGYDVVRLHRDDAGKLHWHAHETARVKGAWGGAVAGALVGIIFPPAIPATAAVGAALGGLAGHLAKGLEKQDVQMLAAVIEDGQWGLIVVAAGRLDEVVEQAFAHAVSFERRELADVDHSEVGRRVADITDLGAGD